MGLAAVVAVVTVAGCAAIEAVLPGAGAATGGTPIRIVADVEVEHSHEEGGLELSRWVGSWTHTVEGRASRQGFRQSAERVERAQGRGSETCYYQNPAGDFTITWESELSFRGVHHPIIDVVPDGSDALVLYAVPSETTFVHPGSPPCGPGPEVEPGSLESAYFSSYVLDGDRSPRMDSSTKVSEQDGVVIARIPYDELLDGIDRQGTVEASGFDLGLNRVRVSFELSSG